MGSEARLVETDSLESAADRTSLASGAGLVENTIGLSGSSPRGGE
jgi:hypothetical protein